MKKILLTAAAVFVTLSIYAQGTVDFQNSSATVIRNGLTGANVLSAQGIQIALYWAPLSEPNNFTQLGNAVTIGVPVPGRFAGGTRTTGPETVAGGEGWFQVKAWESAYGSTYEAALAAPQMGGRGALVGESAPFRLNTGGGGVPPAPATSILSNPAFTGFTVNVVPEPSVIALGLIGAGSLLLFRRRK